MEKKQIINMIQEQYKLLKEQGITGVTETPAQLINKMPINELEDELRALTEHLKEQKKDKKFSVTDTAISTGAYQRERGKSNDPRAGMWYVDDKGEVTVHPRSDDYTLTKPKWLSQSERKPRLVNLDDIIKRADPEFAKRLENAFTSGKLQSWPPAKTYEDVKTGPVAFISDEMPRNRVSVSVANELETAFSNGEIKGVVVRNAIGNYTCFEYKWKKFARAVVSSDAKISNGQKSEDGRVHWLLVEPVQLQRDKTDLSGSDDLKFQK